MPTIADILNVKMPYKADGRSAFSRGGPRPPLRAHDPARLQRHASPSPRRTWRSAAGRWCATRCAKFGQGDFASLYTGIGPNRQLIGRLAADLRPAAQGKVGTQIANASDMRSVDANSLVHATQVAGSLTGV